MKKASELAAERYAALLSEHGDDVRARLARTMARPEMSYGETTLCDVVSPLFIDRFEWERIAADAETVAGALQTLMDQALDAPGLADALQLSHRKRSFLLRAKRRPRCLAGRLDTLWTPGGSARALEYNASGNGRFAGAVMFTEWLDETFRDAPILAALGKDVSIRGTPAASGIVRMLTDEVERMGRGLPATLAGVLPTPKAPAARAATDGSPGGPPAPVGPPRPLLMPETIGLMQHLSERGIRVVFGMADAFRYEEGRLRLDGEPVDIVVPSWDLLGTCEEGHPIQQAVLDDVAVCVEGFPTGVELKHKSRFAFLSDRAWSHLFAPDVQETLRRTIPWTRPMVRGTTSYGDDDVDLETFVVDNAHRLVLKAGADWAGNSVVLGWEVDPAEWVEIVQSAFADGDVVAQERVEAGRARFVRAHQAAGDPGEEMYFDVNPYVWNGRVEGCVVRASRSAVLNVAKGGSLVPAFIVDHV